MTPLRIGIVGPGKVGALHAAALAAIPDARLAGVCGRRLEPARQFAERWDARAYKGLDDMLASGSIDAAIICTPHPLHCEQAVAAAEAGAHVLVEKPMAMTAAECDQMISAADRAGVRLGVVSQRRWYPPVQRMHAAVAAERIGAPILGTVSLLGWRGADYYAMDPWRGTQEGEGGGVLINQAVHNLDLLLWMMGSALTDVSALVANLNHPQIEVEDTAVAVLRFASGALGVVTASNSQRPGLHGNVHAHGQSGYSVGAQTDGGSSFVAGVSAGIEVPFNDVWTIPGEEHLPEQWLAQEEEEASDRDLIAYYLRCQVADFIDAVRDDRPPAVAGEDGRRAVALIEAIYASAESGAPVRLAQEARNP